MNRLISICKYVFTNHSSILAVLGLVTLHLLQIYDRLLGCLHEAILFFGSGEEDCPPCDEAICWGSRVCDEVVFVLELHVDLKALLEVLTWLPVEDNELEEWLDRSLK